MSEKQHKGRIKDWAKLPWALPAPAAPDTAGLVEMGARAVYELMPYDGPKGTAKPAWVPNGNSLKQGEARQYARAVLAALRTAAPDTAGVVERAEELQRKLEKEERNCEQLIVERDDAEQALSQAYYLVTGRSPEWSNHFGRDEALEEIEDALALLRESADAIKRLLVGHFISILVFP